MFLLLRFSGLVVWSGSAKGFRPSSSSSDTLGSVSPGGGIGGCDFIDFRGTGLDRLGGGPGGAAKPDSVLA